MQTVRAYNIDTYVHCSLLAAMQRDEQMQCARVGVAGRRGIIMGVIPASSGDDLQRQKLFNERQVRRTWGPSPVIVPELPVPPEG